MQPSGQEARRVGSRKLNERMEWGKAAAMGHTAETHVTPAGYCLEMGCESWEE